MASVFVLLEAFTRKEAAALGFFPCATASEEIPKLDKNTFLHKFGGVPFALRAYLCYNK